MSDDNPMPFLKFLVKEGRFVLVRPHQRTDGSTPKLDHSPSEGVATSEEVAISPHGEANSESKEEEGKRANVLGIEKKSAKSKTVASIAAEEPPDRVEVNSIHGTVLETGVSVEHSLPRDLAPSSTSMRKMSGKKTSSRPYPGKGAGIAQGLAETRPNCSSQQSRCSTSARSVLPNRKTSKLSNLHTEGDISSRSRIRHHEENCAEDNVHDRCDVRMRGQTDRNHGNNHPKQVNTGIAKNTQTVQSLQIIDGKEKEVTFVNSSSSTRSTHPCLQDGSHARTQENSIATVATWRRDETAEITEVHREKLAVDRKPNPNSTVVSTTEEITQIPNCDYQHQHIYAKLKLQSHKFEAKSKTGRTKSMDTEAIGNHSRRSSGENTKTLSSTEVHSPHSSPDGHLLKSMNAQGSGSNICDSILFGMDHMLSNMAHSRPLENDLGNIASESIGNERSIPSSTVACCDGIPHIETDAVPKESSCSTTSGKTQLRTQARSFPGIRELTGIEARNRLGKDPQSATSFPKFQQDDRNASAEDGKSDNGNVVGAGVWNKRQALHDVDASLSNIRNTEIVMKFDSVLSHRKNFSMKAENTSEENMAGFSGSLSASSLRGSGERASRPVARRITCVRQVCRSKKKRKSATGMFLHVLLTATERMLPVLKHAQDSMQDVLSSMSRLGEVVMPDSLLDQSDQQTASNHNNLAESRESHCSMRNNDVCSGKTVVSNLRQTSNHERAFNAPLEEAAGIVSSCADEGISGESRSAVSSHFNSSHEGMGHGVHRNVDDHAPPAVSSFEGNHHQEVHSVQNPEQMEFSPVSSNIDSSDSNMASENIESNTCGRNEGHLFSQSELDSGKDQPCEDSDFSDGTSEELLTRLYQSSGLVECTGDYGEFDETLRFSPNSQLKQTAHIRDQTSPVLKLETEAGVSSPVTVSKQDESYPSPVSVELYDKVDQHNDACMQLSGQSEAMDLSVRGPGLPTSSHFVQQGKNEKDPTEIVALGKTVSVDDDVCSDPEESCSLFKEEENCLLSSVTVPQEFIHQKADLVKESTPELTGDEEEHLRQLFDQPSSIDVNAKNAQMCIALTTDVESQLTPKLTGDEERDLRHLSPRVEVHVYEPIQGILKADPVKESTPELSGGVQRQLREFDRSPSMDVNAEEAPKCIRLNGDLVDESTPELTGDEEEHLRQLFDQPLCVAVNTEDALVRIPLKTDVTTQLTPKPTGDEEQLLRPPRAEVNDGETLEGIRPRANVKEEHPGESIDDPSDLQAPTLGEDEVALEDMTSNATSSDAVIKTEILDNAVGLQEYERVGISQNLKTVVKLEANSLDKDYVSSSCDMTWPSIMMSCSVSESDPDLTVRISNVKIESTSTLSASSDGHEKCSHDYDNEPVSLSLSQVEEVTQQCPESGASNTNVRVIGEAAHQSTRDISPNLSSTIHSKAMSHDFVTSTDSTKNVNDSLNMSGGVNVTCKDDLASNTSPMVSNDEPCHPTAGSNEDNEEVVSADSWLMCRQLISSPLSSDLDDEMDGVCGHPSSIEDNSPKMQGAKEPTVGSNESTDEGNYSGSVSPSDSDSDLPSFLFPDENMTRQKKLGKRPIKKTAVMELDENVSSPCEGGLDSQNEMVITTVAGEEECELDQAGVESDVIERGRDELDRAEVSGLGTDAQELQDIDSQIPDHRIVHKLHDSQEDSDAESDVNPSLVQDSDSRERKSHQSMSTSSYSGRYLTHSQSDVTKKPRTLKEQADKRVRDTNKANKHNQHKSKEGKATISEDAHAKRYSDEDHHGELSEVSNSEDPDHRNRSKQLDGVGEEKHTSMSSSKANSPCTAVQSTVSRRPSTSESSPLPHTSMAAVSSTEVDQTESNVDRAPTTHDADRTELTDTCRQAQDELADTCRQAQDELADTCRQAQYELTDTCRQTQDELADTCRQAQDDMEGDPETLEDGDVLPIITLTLRKTPKKIGLKPFHSPRTLDNGGIYSDQNLAVNAQLPTVATFTADVHDGNDSTLPPRTDNLQCPVCSLVFNGQDVLCSHLAFSCSICDKAFCKQRNLTQHLVTHAGGCTECPLCGKVLLYFSKIEVHMRTHSGEKPFACKACGMCFTVKSSLKSHTIQHSNVSITCDVCHKVFRDPVLLARHVRIHGKRMFDCDVCGKAFKRRSHLKHHMTIHTGQKDYACDVCESRFSTPNSLRSHILIHIGKRDFKCDVCQKRFSTVHHLKSHLRIHTGQKGYTCNICGKSFSHPGTMQIHMRVHTGARPYQCETCGKRFTQSSHLRTHQQVHKEWTVECSKCDRRFLNQQRLEEHFKIHLSLRLFKCDLCLKQMMSMKGLLTHKRRYCRKTVHPFKCDDCGDRFRCVGSLKLHQKRHSPQGEFPCKVCQKTFSLISKLIKHQITMHQFMKCSLCEDTLPCTADLDRHLREHMTDGGYQCPSCSVVLAGLPDMEEHIQTHGRKTVYCTTCNTHYSSKRHYQEHVKRKHSSGEPSLAEESRFAKTNALDAQRTDISSNSGRQQIYTCDICLKTFHDGACLIKHALKHSKSQNTPHNLPQQKTSIQSKNGKEVSNDSTKANKKSKLVAPKSGAISSECTFTCEICGNAYTSDKRLQKHSERKHQTDNDAGGTDNDKSQSQRETRKHHHHEEKTKSREHNQTADDVSLHKKRKFKCGNCGKCFYSPGYLEHHMNTHHPTSEGEPLRRRPEEVGSIDAPPEKQFRCEECGSVFYSPGHLQHHMKKHSVLALQCRECQRKFSDQYHLEKHEKKHHADKPKKVFECEVCSKVYGSKRALAEHALKHTGAMPFQCDKCDRSFNSKSCLRSHRIRHLGVKPYKCEVCEKAFYEKLTLDNHMRMHSGDKPFPCTVCGKCFSEKGSRRKHMIVHTSLKPFKCDVCERKFSGLNLLKLHSIVHSDILPFICDVCEKPHRTKQRLEMHMRIHIGNYSFKCDECGKAFVTKAQLHLHEKIHHTVDRIHCCETCHKKFKSTRDLQKHMLTHQSINKFKCEKCGKKFKSSGYLSCHMKIHSDRRNYACEQCSFRTQNRRYLTVHQLTHTDRTKNNKCDICEKSFFTLTNLVNHRKMHTSLRPFTCEICDALFKSQAGITLHLKTHSMEKPFECKICHKRFTQRSNMKTHLRSHTGERPFKCSVCDISYACQQSVDRCAARHSGQPRPKQECRICHKMILASGMRTHIEGHSSIKPFKCTECSDSFKRKDSLRSHMVTHTGLRAWTCKLCGKAFTQRSTLVTHSRYHKGERPYKCSLCDRTFTQNSHLRTHEKGVHRKEKTHECDICSKTFASPAILRDHYRIHTGEKPFKCQQCGNSFPRSSALKSHLLVHSQVKRYKCDFCSMAFAHANTLKGHRRTHTGEKPYACDICGETFSRNDGLQTHRQKHTGGRPYSCQSCDKTFTTSSSLKTHTRTHIVKTFPCEICDKSFTLQKDLTKHRKSHTDNETEQ